MVIAGGVNTAYQLGQNKPYDENSLVQTGLSTLLTRNRTLGQQVSINIGLSTLGTQNPDDYGWNALGAVSGTLLGNYSNKVKSKNKMIDYLAVPAISSYSNEYIGDSKNIKKYFDKVNLIESKNEKK